MNEPRLVTVASYQTMVIATVARNKLEAAGITTFLLDAETITTDWMLSDALGGVKLQVKDDDLNRAQEVLAEKMDEVALAEMEAEAVATYAELQQNEQDTETPLSDRENLAEQAWRGALLSFLFLPMACFVVKMLMGVASSKESLRPLHRKHAWYAAYISIPMVFLMIAIVLVLLITTFSGY